MSVETLIEWNKWFFDRDDYMKDFHVKCMKRFGHHVDEEEDGSSKDEESEENSEEEEEIEEGEEINKEE